MLRRMADRLSRIRKEPSTNVTPSTPMMPPMSTPVVTAFNDVINQFLPIQGHEKLLRSALFNTITFCSVLAVIGTIVAVFFVLEPFLRPLLWSLLCGSALFPFKHRLTKVTRRWIREMKSKNQSITVESVSLPVKVGTWILDGIINKMMDYYKLLSAIFVSLLTVHLLIYYFTVTETILEVISTFWTFLSFLVHVLMSPNHSWVIYSTGFAHVFMVTLFWSPTTKNFLISSSPIIILSVSCQVLASLGAIGLFLVMSATFLVAVGVISSLFGISPKKSAAHQELSFQQTDRKSTETVDSGHSTSEEDEDDLTSVGKKLLTWIWSWISSLLPSHHINNYFNQSSDSLDEGDLTNSLPEDESSSPDEEGSKFNDQSTLFASPIKSPVSDFPDSPIKRGIAGSTSRPSNLSNVYIYCLLWTCCLAYVWVNPQVLLLLPIPVILLSLRWLWNHILMPPSISVIYGRLYHWLNVRKDAIFHPLIRRKFFKYLVLGDQMMAELLEKSLDTLCSLSVIVLVISGLFLAAAFLAFQIYGESIHLVNMVGNIVNSTITNHPELSSLFSSDASNLTSNVSFFDEMIGNAYLYGRKWLKHAIRSVLNVGTDDASVNASVAIERQLLEVWDRSYQTWLKRNDLTPPASPTDGSFGGHPLRSPTGEYDWATLFTAFKTLNFGLCFHVFKENLDTVLSVLESVWTLVKGNLSIFMSILTAIMSILLSGSSALLNASLNFIVFSTSLFYLLCASDDQYKPIEWVSQMFPTSSNPQPSAHPKTPFLRLSFLPKANRNNKFVRAFNEGINSVFAASLKMATFYGLYTWLIHVLFQTKLVYIPSVTAALLGAVPFIGSYWASFPAVLELYLIHGLMWKSLLMLTCSILPMYFVDSAIYAEIKGGGHPYLTGLSIAGGVFFKGFEGAIFGPILLCCLFVAVNIYKSVVIGQDDPDMDPLQVRRRHLKKMNSTIS